MSETTTDELDGTGDDGWVDADDDGEYVYVPEEGGLGRKLLVSVVTILVFLGLVVGVSAYWLYGQVNGTGAETPVAFTVPPEATVAQIANLLEEDGIVSDATLFRYYARWRDLQSIQAGEYQGLTTNDAMADVVDVLAAGPDRPAGVPYTELAVPEGLRLTEIGQRALTQYPEMNDQELSAALATVRSRYQPEGALVEGLLFPATYQVLDTDRADEVKLVTQMVETFDATADEIGLADAPAQLAGQAGSVELTPYDIVIIASLIEEEAKTPEDRARISRVIYNRLARGMRLEIDATVLYAVGQQGGEITQSMLNTDSPYNTRRNAGLPPTPIASPGRDSLLAAMNPSTEPGAENWLYYVLIDEQGNHFFTGDYDEFLTKVDEAREKGLL
ncbi:MAG: endolytic transglycosylase MltG [Acidimicrobiales bacterium]|nr:endolytic transglycosylase MltG [Acidimicrobiales bacterium]